MKTSREVLIIYFWNKPGSSEWFIVLGNNERLNKVGLLRGIPADKYQSDERVVKEEFEKQVGIKALSSVEVTVLGGVFSRSEEMNVHFVVHLVTKIEGACDSDTGKVVTEADGNRIHVSSYKLGEDVLNFLPSTDRAAFTKAYSEKCKLDKKFAEDNRLIFGVSLMLKSS